MTHDDVRREIAQSGPRARLSAMTATVTVGDTPTSTVAVSADGRRALEPGEFRRRSAATARRRYSTADRPIQATATVDDADIAAIVASAAAPVASCSCSPAMNAMTRSQSRSRRADRAPSTP